MKEREKGCEPNVPSIFIISSHFYFFHFHSLLNLFPNKLLMPVRINRDEMGSALQNISKLNSFLWDLMKLSSMKQRNIFS